MRAGLGLGEHGHQRRCLLWKEHAQPLEQIDDVLEFRIQPRGGRVLGAPEPVGQLLHARIHEAIVKGTVVAGGIVQESMRLAVLSQRGAAIQGRAANVVRQTIG